MTYVDPDDAGGLARACNDLLENPSGNCRNGEEAYQSGKRYPLLKMKEQYLDIYQQLSGAAPKAVPVL